MARTHSRERLTAVVLVGVGGFAGSNLRYVVDTAVPSSLVATATVNVLGCLALGFLLYEELYRDGFSQSTRTVLATGVIASFTTYSTFVLDALTTTPIVAVGYIVASYVTGFAGVLLDRQAARRFTNAGDSSSGVTE
jgi:CrcB protein